ncbi:MAG: penicillin-binding protein activator LpoB [bacterium]|nr:penicillin-binding protein activator LpoB [bacterium]
MRKRLLYFLSLLIGFSLFIGCSSTPKKLDTNEDMLADTGELTLIELQKSAVRIGKTIGEYFKKNPNPDGVFVALLPTKNDTSEQIAVDVYDNTLVSELRKNGIFTVRTATRNQALSEIQFSQTGLTDKPLSVGKMKSPNYFVKTDINESMFRHSGDRIVEQAINTEMIEVTTQIAAWSDRVTYRKKAVSGSGTGW